MTREEIESQGWFGEQKPKVLALLARVEKAETTAKRLLEKAVLIVDRAAKFSDHPVADSDIRSDFQRELWAIYQGVAP